MTKIRVGVFGSAFDPPTYGHRDVLQQAAPFFDKILLVPSACHAFSKKMQPFKHRITMLKLFLGALSLGTCTAEICAIESTLLAKDKASPIYTFDLMEALEKSYCGEAVLSFIRGPDNAIPDVWQTFYKAREIEQRWTIYTAHERIKVRSSKVREVIASGAKQAQKARMVKQLLFPSVYDYIESQALYRTTML
ncbi:MAG: adenylyltransferase/cytidyltransferase family protein [Endozoicomonas sp. (ex Botrylloides leachii)]|nr:adenylyltransferase/cytidyltransferase family protein [Endozoicomonas sp. (ex Botrylloides leachii)]